MIPRVNFTEGGGSGGEIEGERHMEGKRSGKEKNVGKEKKD